VRERVVAYDRIGHADSETGDCWAAVTDHMDRLGEHYLGEHYFGNQYLAVGDRLAEVRSQLAPGFAAVLN